MLLADVVSSIVSAAGPSLLLTPVDSFHVSLSKTAYILYGQIKPFLTAARDVFGAAATGRPGNHAAFVMAVRRELVYFVNEERNTTFVALPVGTAHAGSSSSSSSSASSSSLCLKPSAAAGQKGQDSNLLGLITSADKVMTRWNASPYYDNPQPHMTIAWASGDVIQGLQRCLADWPASEQNRNDGAGHRHEQPNERQEALLALRVDHVVCKTGDQHHRCLLG